MGKRHGLTAVLTLLLFASSAQRTIQVKTFDSTRQVSFYIESGQIRFVSVDGKITLSETSLKKFAKKNFTFHLANSVDALIYKTAFYPDTSAKLSLPFLETSAFKLTSVFKKKYNTYYLMFNRNAMDTHPATNKKPA
jgi:hypothetical protein